ncbi:DNA-binding domain-containing protein [Roseobacter sp.]|uniref:DNA-binding domain-containing protein n=1 Tax=Roseobacter sp. TaxID=1907202 RepID=UPI0025D057DA|nr:DNA-binding domain-containing protein [Roseobacter sp.]
MTVTEAQFREALLDPDAPVPAGLVSATGAPAGARYSVYRNNVTVSLCQALATAFPLVAKLLGPENFAGLSKLYVRQHPPTSQLMMFYGTEFPEFLGGIASLAHLGYLPDCARLDLALRQSYHAADGVALDPAELQMDPALLAGLRLAPAPATRVLRSSWPLFDLWRYNTEAGAPKPRAVAQDVLITRPEFDPVPVLLPAGAAAWLDALARGMTLGEANDAALRDTADFDLSAALSTALQTKSLSTLKKDKTL